jgi:hypothetical protein
MVESDNLRYTRIALNNGSGTIPALGFGTLIPDPMATRTATKAALEAGFRQLDASERYRNENEVDVLAQFAEAGIDLDALAAQLQDEGAKSFVKSWNELMAVIASKSAALAKAS